MIDQIYLDVLTQLGTHKVSHSKRTLFEHLIGTHDLLEAWKLPRKTCLAGLFHSIYGTVRFESQAVPITSRKTIQDLIGLEAELLAYLFCVSDRREFYANIGCSTCRLHDSRGQTQWEGSPAMLNELLSMDLANWLEMYPYVGPDLSETEVTRTVQMFEEAKASFPAIAFDALMEFKQSTCGKLKAFNNRNFLT